MCSSAGGVEMENYQGDLTDIIRAGGGTTTTGPSSSSDHHHHHVNIINNSPPNWDLVQFPCVDPLNYTCTTIDDHHHHHHRDSIFGDPFSHIGDPLLLHHQHQQFNNNINMSVSETSAAAAGGFCQQKSVFHEDDIIQSPCNIFSRIQISPSLSQSPKLMPCESSSPVVIMSSPSASTSSPRGIIKAPALLTSDMINANPSKNTSCLIDNTAPLQISSPRNLGIKRRKSQAKKTVCIPAPAAANSRSSGEVVPSDLWAWRKYGQKPIKGSPYPRGYYRCSSSKGCSARKQVERSRADPNMLVITYTSEHNHPWPTQRNALAGSTRSQPSKINNATSAAASKNSSSSQTQNNTTTKEEVKENSNDTMSPIVGGGGGSSSTAASVKEEFEENINDHKQFEIDQDADLHHHHHHHHHQFSTIEGFSQTYKPALPDDDDIIHSNQSEDFFADLGEIETDPLNLLFTQGFSTGGDGQKESKALDPFNLFDWSATAGVDTTHNNNNSFGDQEAKRGL
ncbi:hypothetical protein LWI29_011185 [Acer saccharum]|uniref:WRKY domain-containing protein n=1 Tax=Acer saccharum TaxID=4024 RepID=A0AA39VFV2_ACESA|nr:hypothetical protein LWI29_011185 [Acer saccharum]